jgi:hypothetical protein
VCYCTIPTYVLLRNTHVDGGPYEEDAFAVLVLLAAGLAPVVSADQTQPSPAIPTPPGAKVTTELNMDREQILTQIQGFASAFALDGSGKIEQSDLEEALGSLERVQYAEMQVTGKYTSSDLVAFYEKEVGGRRVVYDISGGPSRGTLLLKSPNGDGYLFVSINIAKYSAAKPSEARIRAGRIFGFPDVAKATKLLMPLVLMVTKLQ